MKYSGKVTLNLLGEFICIVCNHICNAMFHISTVFLLSPSLFPGAMQRKNHVRQMRPKIRSARFPTHMNSCQITEQLKTGFKQQFGDNVVAWKIHSHLITT